MASVMVRDSSGDDWRVAVPPWKDIHSERAESIVETYNSRDCYSKEYKVDYEDWETPSNNMKTGDVSE